MRNLLVFEIHLELRMFMLSWCNHKAILASYLKRRQLSRLKSIMACSSDRLIFRAVKDSVEYALEAETVRPLAISTFSEETYTIGT